MRINVLSVSLFLLSILFAPQLLFAHGNGDGHDEEEPRSQFEKILPFMYFEEGDWVTGIFVIIFWIAILKGLFELSLLVLGRVIK